MRTLLGLQYLRALAATSIIVYHASDRASAPIVGLEASVDLFFILSGFLMVTIISPATTASGFLIDRIKRIVPVYWIVTSLMLLAYYLGMFRYLEVDFAHVLTSYFFIPSFSPKSGSLFPLLVPGWTLNYEMLFYIIFGLLLLIKDRRMVIPALSAIFMAFVILGLLFHPQSAIGRSYSDPLVLTFLMGAWLGVLWKRRAIGSPRTGWTLIVLSIAALILVSIGSKQPNFQLISFGLPALGLVAGVLCIEQRPGGIPSFALPRLLGDASYSTYLWHTLIIGVVARVCEILSVPLLVMVILAVLASLVGGVLGYKLIEQPILKMLKRRSALRARPAPVTALTQA